MKRTKNSRFMHMVFHVQSGTVEVRVHDNEFTIHRHGIWQVPRGTLLSVFLASVLARFCSFCFLFLEFFFPALSAPGCTTAVNLRSTPSRHAAYSPMGVMQRHTASVRQEQQQKPHRPGPKMCQASQTVVRKAASHALQKTTAVAWIHCMLCCYLLDHHACCPHFLLLACQGQSVVWGGYRARAVGWPNYQLPTKDPPSERFLPSLLLPAPFVSPSF